MPSDTITRRKKLKEVFPHFSLKGYDGLEEYQDVIDSDEAEIIYKAVETKAGSDGDINDDEMSIVSYINTLAMDRDQEVVLPDGAIFDHYTKNPIVLLSHDYWADNTGGVALGRAAWVKKDKKGLIAKTIYNPNCDAAQRVYQSRKAGFPMMTSIGFIALAWVGRNDAEYVKTYKAWEKAYKKAYGEEFDSEKFGTPRYFVTKWLLLEYSEVVVGSNPEALEVQDDGKKAAGGAEYITRTIDADKDDGATEEQKGLWGAAQETDPLDEIKMLIVDRFEAIEKRIDNIEKTVEPEPKPEPVKQKPKVYTIDEVRKIAADAAQEERARQRGIVQL